MYNSLMTSYTVGEKCTFGRCVCLFTSEVEDMYLSFMIISGHQIYLLLTFMDYSIGLTWLTFMKYNVNGNGMVFPMHRFYMNLDLLIHSC